MQFKASGCFSLFSAKFTASGISFDAEILDSGGLEPSKNSETAAVFRCSPRFSSEKDTLRPGWGH